MKNKCEHGICQPNVTRLLKVSGIARHRSVIRGIFCLSLDSVLQILKVFGVENTMQLQRVVPVDTVNA